MDKLSIEETLQKEGSDFKSWPRSIDTKVLDNACPECKTDVLCAYADTGVTEFCDTYHHICMNSACDYLEKKDVFGIGMGEREVYGPSPCPYCHRKIY